MLFTNVLCSSVRMESPDSAESGTSPPRTPTGDANVPSWQVDYQAVHVVHPDGMEYVELVKPRRVIRRRKFVLNQQMESPTPKSKSHKDTDEMMRSLANDASVDIYTPPLEPEELHCRKEQSQRVELNSSARSSLPPTSQLQSSVSLEPQLLSSCTELDIEPEGTVTIQVIVGPLRTYTVRFSPATEYQHQRVVTHTSETPQQITSSTRSSRRMSVATLARSSSISKMIKSLLGTNAIVDTSEIHEITLHCRFVGCRNPIHGLPHNHETRAGIRSFYDNYDEMVARDRAIAQAEAEARAKHQQQIALNDVDPTAQISVSPINDLTNTSASKDNPVKQLFSQTRRYSRQLYDQSMNPKAVEPKGFPYTKYSQER